MDKDLYNKQYMEKLNIPEPIKDFLQSSVFINSVLLKCKSLSLRALMHKNLEGNILVSVLMKFPVNDSV